MSVDSYTGGPWWTVGDEDVLEALSRDTRRGLTEEETWGPPQQRRSQEPKTTLGEVATVVGLAPAETSADGVEPARTDLN